MSMSHPQYRSDIDGLRAFAVWAVIGFHVFPEMFEGGFIGVDIFFVISGFLISTILLNSIYSGRFSFIQFYARRVKRIFPSLLTVLSACLLFGWIALLPDEYSQLGKHTAGGAAFIANIILWSEAGYFDSAAELKPLLHLWSLGIEEQFYLLWPLLLWLGSKIRISPILLTVVLICASFICNVKEIVTNPVATFYSPQTRLWELLCGAVLAWKTLRFQGQSATCVPRSLNSMGKWYSVHGHFLKFQSGHLSNAQSLLGTMFVVFALSWFNKDISFPGSAALIPTFGAALIISAGAGAWINRHILSTPLMVWFGQISFPLYLWHWPLLSFARILEFDVTELEVRLAAVAISVILAWLTYTWIECPIRFGLKRFAGTSDLAVMMILVGVAGFAIYKTDGLSFRLSDKNNEIIEIFSNPLPSVESVDCGELIPEFRGVKFDLGCNLSRRTHPEILFIGDSHMSHYRNAVWREFSSFPIMMAAQTSCLPFPTNNLFNETCKKNYKALINYIRVSKTVKRIYISGSWSYLMSGEYDKGGRNWRLARAPEQDESTGFISNGRSFIEQSLFAGKKVIFMQDIPVLDFDIRSCYDIRPITFQSQKKGDCQLKYSAYENRIAIQKKVISELLINYPQVKVFDPVAVLCDAHICRYEDAMLPYYYNGDHVNWYGANLIIQALARFE